MDVLLFFIRTASKEAKAREEEMEETKIAEMRRKLALFDKLASELGNFSTFSCAKDFTVLCKDGFVREIISLEGQGDVALVVYVVCRRKWVFDHCQEENGSPKTSGVVSSEVTLEKWNELTRGGKFLGTPETGFDYDKNAYTYALYNKH